MDKKLISIIVPVYNQELLLEKCVNSLINQTYGELEIILINDGSTDGSLDLCKKLSKNDKRIIVLDKPNGGVSSARNLGLERAKGDYICFVDSDDYVELNMYEILINYQMRYKTDLVKCAWKKELNGNIIPKDLGYEARAYDLTIEEDEEQYFGLFGDCKIFSEPTNYLIRADIAKSIRFREEYAFGEDLLYMIEVISKAKSIYVSTETLYIYHLRDDSAVLSITNYSRNINNIILVNKDICDIVKKEYWNDFSFSNGHTIYRYLEKACMNKCFDEVYSSINEWEKLMFLIDNMPWKKLTKFQRMFFKLLKRKKKEEIAILFKLKSILIR